MHCLLEMRMNGHPTTMKNKRKVKSKTSSFSKANLFQMTFFMFLCLGLTVKEVLNEEQKWVASTGEILDLQIRQGLVFLKRGNSILTGDKWT